MITKNEIAMAEYEAGREHKPWVILRERGWQEGCGSMKGRMLFNIVACEDSTQEQPGSTVTIETMLARGYRVEITK